MGTPTLEEILAKLDGLIGDAMLAWMAAQACDPAKAKRLGKLHDRLCTARAFATAKREEG